MATVLCTLFDVSWHRPTGEICATAEKSKSIMMSPNNCVCVLQDLTYNWILKKDMSDVSENPINPLDT